MQNDRMKTEAVYVDELTEKDIKEWKKSNIGARGSKQALEDVKKQGPW